MDVSLASTAPEFRFRSMVRKYGVTGDNKVTDECRERKTAINRKQMLSKMMNENVEEKDVRPLTEIHSIDGKYGLSP